MSLFRRAGAQIAKILASTVDPAAAAGQLQLYAKDVAGVVQLFARASDGTISQLSPRSGQIFRYVATGLEANPFPVAVPVARASANYNVQITGGGPQANAIKDFRALVSTFTINGFDVEAGAGLQAGDILMITVEDLT